MDNQRTRHLHLEKPHLKRAYASTAFVAAALVPVLASNAAVGWAGEAGVDPAAAADGGPRAKVEFIQTVSGPTPFTDNCVPAGDPLAEIEPFVDAEVEPHLSVNPTNPKHLLATWQQDRYSGGGARSNLAAVSHNGGKNWRSTTLPGVSSCTGGERTRASDPWTAIGADGAAYVSSFAVDAPPNATDVTDEFDGDTVINRSHSGGPTWETAAPVAEDDGTYWHEKAAIVADPHAPETLYAVWGRHLMPDPTPLIATLDVAAAFSRSDDGGRTWSDPVALPPDLPEVNEWPHGGLLALPPEDGLGPSRLVVVASATGARVTAEPPCPPVLDDIERPRADVDRSGGVRGSVQCAPDRGLRARHRDPRRDPVRRQRGCGS